MQPGPRRHAASQSDVGQLAIMAPVVSCMRTVRRAERVANGGGKKGGAMALTRGRVQAAPHTVPPSDCCFFLVSPCKNSDR